MACPFHEANFHRPKFYLTCIISLSDSIVNVKMPESFIGSQIDGPPCTKAVV